ncbi:MAG TPA: helix-turn-helix transcriptional regulator [Saprospiraceae bacterium]|nr:helix-turn-helix transcriptional regulator [Saprospiraceae bacterium]HMQ82130.1 helix-turn-helix transcriptional regulator [Saprospiraceae bacterium]
MVAVFPLEDYTALRQARRVMRYLVIYCTEGNARITIDEKSFELQENEVITVTSGQVHFLENPGEAQGLVLEFSFDFFCKDDADLELIFHNGLFCHFDLNEIVKLPNRKSTTHLLEQIRLELERKPHQHLMAIHAYVKLMLIAINRAKIEQGSEVWKPEALFLKFLELVRANFRHNYPLKHYTALLQTTELKLNELSKAYTGKTAQMVLFGLIASEAKRLLIYEKISIKEIAAALGFNDPFYFSHFFKKQVGISPKGWRERIG